MKLKVKTLLVITSTMFLFVALLFLVIRPYMFKDSIELDKTNTTKNLEGIKNSLDSEMDDLNGTNRNWAVWDDTYSFLQGKYPNYPRVNLQNDTFENNRVNFLVFVNNEEHVVYQKGYDLENHKEIVLNNSFAKAFMPLIPNTDVKNHTILVTTEYGLAGGLISNDIQK